MSNRFSSSSNRGNASQGSWLLAEELFEAGDSAFVDEICRISDADRLGAFAKTWFSDHRPEARRLLQEYLQLPLAHYRHEALVKRLFKMASAAGDDEVMGWFMVALDRGVRREVLTKQRYNWQTREQWTEQSVRVIPNTEISKKFDQTRSVRTDRMTEVQRERYEQWRNNSRLFSVRTRNYLRRRAWRYFREIGKQNAKRYVESMSRVLPLYTDDYFPDGLALVDNWSLTHVLFHESAVLESRSSGWHLRDGKSLSDLRPAPAFQSEWIASPGLLVSVLSDARGRPVRQWCLRILKEHCESSMRSLPIETLIKWLGNEDVELAEFAAQLLANSDGSASLKPDDWLKLFVNSNVDALSKVCEVANRHLTADSFSMDELLSLACSKPAPLVRLSLAWLQQRDLSDDERSKVLVLIDAMCEALREPLLNWMVNALRGGGGGGDHRMRLLELLDAGRDDVRKASWQWFTSDEVLRQDVQLWQQLMESPYHDVRLGLVDQLRRNELPIGELSQRLVRSSQLDAGLLRVLWSTTLLGIDRGGKHKPTVIKALADRLERRPIEVKELLPILTIAVRSVRSVEFRAGLAAVMQLIESRPELAEVIEENFPELELNVS